MHVTGGARTLQQPQSLEMKLMQNKKIHESELPLRLGYKESIHVGPGPRVNVIHESLHP